MKKLFIIAIAVVASLGAAGQSHRTVTRNPSQEEKLNDQYCSGLFRSTDGTILNVASNPSVSSYNNILDWMRGRVAGFSVYTNRAGVLIPLIRGNVPGIFVDETQVSASSLAFLNVNDIAMVKVIKMPFFGGFNSANGAIAIYTTASEED